MTDDPNLKSGGDPFNSADSPVTDPPGPDSRGEVPPGEVPSREDPSAEQPAAPAPAALPTAPLLPMPKLWIGYALAAATFAGEMIAIARHPELLDAPDSAKDAILSVPPLEVFLPLFVSYVFWMVCIHRYHKILAAIPHYKHPISPAKAVGFHFIPFFWLVWVFIWPKEVAKFVNARFEMPAGFGMPLMRGWVFGIGAIGAMLCQIFLDPGMGIALLFISTAYVGGFLSRALSIPSELPR
ncbi:MAG TPA: hypothetical protein VKT53_05215 [Candidatus Acidoferrum sp.]|nr:hypothetical protein [Candidatus Acidoferrum sp.]